MMDQPPYAPDQLIRVAIPKAGLERMPENIRGALLLAGHMGNELNTLSLLLLFSIRRHGNEYLDKFTMIHSWTILRLFIGKIVEAANVMQDVILRPPVRDEFLPLIHPDNLHHLDLVKKIIGRNGPLRTTRTEHSFHYPSPAQMEAGFKAASPEEDWALYSSLARSSGFYMFADIVSLRAMAAGIGDNPVVSIDTLSKEAIEAADAIQSLIENMVPGILNKYGVVDEFKEVMKIDDRIPYGKDFKIPPLTRGHPDDDVEA